MFKQISMTNFKSWRETGPVRLAPLTGFFGANSSGKSSLLQMLLLLKQTAESNDRNLVLKTGSIQEGYVNLGTAHEITFRNSNEMKLSVVWELPAKPVFSIPVPQESESVNIEELAFETVIHAAQQRIYVDKLRYWSRDSLSVQLSRQPNNHYTIRIEVDGKPPIRAQGRPRVYMKPESATASLMKPCATIRIPAISATWLCNLSEGSSNCSILAHCVSILSGPILGPAKTLLMWG